MIVDDEINRLLVNPLPPGVRMHIVIGEPASGLLDHVIALNPRLHCVSTEQRCSCRCLPQRVSV